MTVNPMVEPFGAALNTEAVNDAFRRMRGQMRGLTLSFRRAHEAFVSGVNDERHVSGLEARYYVRGALAQVDVDDLVSALLRDPGSVAADDDESMLLPYLTPASRARLAAAAARGYAEAGRAEPPVGPGLPWHRLVGGARLEVS
jgi:hypothetical protein